MPVSKAEVLEEGGRRPGRPAIGVGLRSDAQVQLCKALPSVRVVFAIVVLDRSGNCSAMACPLLPCLFQFAITLGEDRLFENVEFVGGRRVANSAVQPQ